VVLNHVEPENTEAAPSRMPLEGRLYRRRRNIVALWRRSLAPWTCGGAFTNRWNEAFMLLAFMAISTICGLTSGN